MESPTEEQDEIRNGWLPDPSCIGLTLAQAEIAWFAAMSPTSDFRRAFARGSGNGSGRDEASKTGGHGNETRARTQERR